MVYQLVSYQRTQSSVHRPQRNESPSSARLCSHNYVWPPTSTSDRHSPLGCQHVAMLSWIELPACLLMVSWMMVPGIRGYPMTALLRISGGGLVISLFSDLFAITSIFTIALHSLAHSLCRSFALGTVPRMWMILHNNNNSELWYYTGKIISDRIRSLALILRITTVIILYVSK